MILRNCKGQDKKFKGFLNEHLEFLSKHFAENEKEKLFLNDLSFLSSLKNDKANTILTI